MTRQNLTLFIAPVLILALTLTAGFGCEDQDYRSDSNVSGDNNNNNNNNAQTNADEPCKALPFCQPGEFERAAPCPDCYEVSKCGTTIYCEDSGGDVCMALPFCPGGTEAVSGPCPPDDSCEAVTVCGSTILCREVPDVCGAVPTCPPHAVAVDACPMAGGENPCEEVELCGQTVSCQHFPPECSARPSCGDQEPLSTEPCDGDELGCRESAACGVTLYCRDQVDPFECTELPACGPGSVDTQDPCEDDADCFEISVCDRTVSCNPAPDFVCDDAPQCPEGHAPSHAPCADGEPGCTHDTVCGETLYCREFLTSCAAPPTCEGDLWLTQRRCGELAEEHMCTEHYRCMTFVSCRVVDEDCDGIPACPDGTITSENPCRDGEEGCRDGSACGLTLFCRDSP